MNFVRKIVFLCEIYELLEQKVFVADPADLKIGLETQ